MQFKASTWLVVFFVALASSLDVQPGSYRRDIVNFPDQILPRECTECCPITIRTILTTIYSTIYSDTTIYETTTEITTEKTTETTTETSVSTKLEYVTNSTTLYVTVRPSCSIIPCATDSVTKTVTAPGPVTTITTTTTISLPCTTTTRTSGPSSITDTRTQTSGAPSATESHPFSVTLCPAPTGLSSPPDTTSDLTFGCKPGSVCNPPKPDNCNFWPDPPSEDFLCDPSCCIPSPPISTPSWDDCDKTIYYPPSYGYFNLNPEIFGLSYHIFESPGTWAHRRQETVKRAVTPAVCFDDCNNAYIIALSVGKTEQLCADGSAFRESYASCTACIMSNTNSTVNNVLDYLRPEFSQFINYCNGKLPVTKPSSSSTTSEPVGTTQSSVVVTSTQVETTSSVFTPIDPSTSIQTSQSAPVSSSSSQDQSSEPSPSSPTTTTAAVTDTTATSTSSTTSPSSAVGETSASSLPGSSPQGSTSMSETTSDPTASTTPGDYSSTGDLGNTSSPPPTATTIENISGKPTVTHASSGGITRPSTPPVVTAAASQLSYHFTSTLIFLSSLMLIIY